MAKLKPFLEVVREIAEKYNVPTEIAESIIRDFIALLYGQIHGVEDKDLEVFDK